MVDFIDLVYHGCHFPYVVGLNRFYLVRRSFIAETVEIVVGTKGENTLFSAYGIAALTYSLRIEGICLHKGFSEKKQMVGAQHIVWI